MATTFDLILMPLAREAGKDQNTFPDLYMAEMPRRPARGRGSDHLILYLTLTGNAPLSPGKQEQVLARLAQTYYKTSGSVTAALRTVAENLNQLLLDRNLRNASSGRQSIGLLTLLTLRGEQIYLAQSGPVHAFIASSAEIQHLFDPQISGRGLGLSRTTHIRYSQAILQPGDTILLATQPSTTWSKGTLTGIHGQGLDVLRRRLFNRSDIDLNALLIQSRQGAGEFHLVSPASIQESSAASLVAGGQKPAAPVSSEADVKDEKELPVPEVVIRQEDHVVLDSQVAEEPAPPQPAEPAFSSQTELQSAPQTVEQETSPEIDKASDHKGDAHSALETGAASPGLQNTISQSVPSPAKETGDSAAVPQAVPGNEAAAKPSRPRVPLAPLTGILAGFGSVLSGIGGRFTQALKMLVRYLMPDESLFTIPSTTMALIAVAVPLVIVSVASVVYIQRGRAGQYDVLFSQAQIAANQAAAKSDLADQRLLWEATLQLLDQAESYRITEDSENLRTQAQSALDGLDLVKRPDYKAAVIGGLAPTVSVTRLVLSNDDLYMLDGNSGNVLRGRVTPQQDYEIDRSFQCGPGIYDNLVVGNLIDIVAAPVGQESDAVILGMDTSGSVLYCYLDKEPKAQMLASPVTAPNWGSLVAFTMDIDQENVYVLDPQDQAVWAYWGADFVDGPEFYFGDQVPNIQDVTTLTVDKRDLYLLHADGLITLCTYSGLDVSPTRCANPRYVDTRPGNADQTLIPKDPFSQILATQPPDPSLYLLEPKSRAIYHFSLRTLNFHSQFVPESGIASGPATAFTVDQIQRVLYLAIGNQVFQASIPQ